MASGAPAADKETAVRNLIFTLSSRATCAPKLTWCARAQGPTSSRLDLSDLAHEPTLTPFSKNGKLLAWVPACAARHSDGAEKILYRPHRFRVHVHPRPQVLDWFMRR
jgi:2-oxoglutarate dehydrogenase E1 component